MVKPMSRQNKKLVCFFALAFLLPFFYFETEATEIFGDWVIASTDNITRIDETIILTGNLTINGILTFENVTLKMNLTADGEYGIFVNSGGKFYIYNSTVTALNPDNNYHFKALSGSNFEMKNSNLSYCGYSSANADTSGLYIATSNALVENNKINNNYYGIYVSGSTPNILKNDISYNKYCGIYLSSSDAIVSYNLIQYQGDYANKVVGYGLYSLSSKPKIDNNTISYNYQYGIYLSSSDATLTYNNIEYHGDSGKGIVAYGLYSTNSKPTITSNTIRSNYYYGIYLSSSDANIIGNFLEKGYYTIYSASSKPNIEYNRFQNNNWYDVFLSSSNARIANNTLDYGSTGVYSSSSSPLIEDNTFNSKGGIYLSQSSGFSVIIRNNNFKSGWQPLYTWNSDITFINNYVKDTSSGLYIYSTSGIIKNNTVMDTKDSSYGYGILCRDSFIRVENNIIKNNPYIGIGIIGGNPTFLGNDISSNGYGFYIANTQYTFVNLTLTGSTKADFYLTDVDQYNNKVGSAKVDLVNTTFGSAKVGDASSVLNVYWYLDVHVYWESDGSNVPNADVKIYEKDNTIAFEGQTDGSGIIRQIRARSYTIVGAVKTNTTPHNVSAEAKSKRNWTYVDIKGNRITSVILDNVAPKLILTYPYEGFITNQTNVQVRGKSEGKAKIRANEIFGNADEFGNFNLTVPLETEGGNLIEVEAKDWMDNLNITTVNVIRDTILPSLNIVEPKDGIYTNENYVYVFGSTESDAKVRVNGVNVEVKDGKFNTTIALENEGENIITVEAEDLAKNIKVIKRKVIYDITPPYIIVVEPKNGTIINKGDEIEIIGVVEQNSILKINNEAISAYLGTFTHKIKLKDGENIIVIEAKDYAGNIKVVMLSVIYDILPPKLNIESPRDNLITNEKMIYVNGTTEDGAKIEINDENVDVKDSRFSFLFELTEGKNNIDVKATDIAGNVKKVRLTVIVDLTPPSISLSYPPYTNQKEVKLEGYIIDGIYVELNGTALELENNKFSVVITLKEGENHISILAKDSVDNTNETKIKIFLDTIPPSLQIIEPKYNKTKEWFVLIKGKTDIDAKVYINGVEGYVDDSGEFRHNVMLFKGDNIIEVKVVDKVGNRKIENLVIFRAEEEKKFAQAQHLPILPVIIIVILMCIGFCTAIYFIQKKKIEYIPQLIYPTYQPQAIPVQPEIAYAPPPKVEKKVEEKTTPVCYNCGKDIDPLWDLCPHCNAKLR
ncbi:MAG: right-handed parallel beta-helix repeat-containing protein [Candidatus Thermoplasmatota archaeon]